MKKSSMNETLPPLEKMHESFSVTTEQLLKAKILEDKSEYFHSEDKGCTMHETRTRHKMRSDVKILYCATHDVKCCRCGWAFNFHYDTESKLLDIYSHTLEKGGDNELDIPKNQAGKN